MNATPRTVLSFGILGFALTITGCSSDADSEQESAPAPTTTTSVAASTAASSDATGATPVGPTSTPASDDSSLLSGDGEVEIRTHAGTYIAPSVEGAVITVDDPAVAEVPAQWVISPGEQGAEKYQVRTVALTDGQASCLALPVDGDVALATCDASDPAQQFAVTSLDRPEQVALSTSTGHLGVDTDDGTLQVFPSGDQLGSTFTLVAR